MGAKLEQTCIALTDTEVQNIASTGTAADAEKYQSTIRMRTCMATLPDIQKLWRSRDSHAITELES